MTDWIVRDARLEDAEGFVRAHEEAWDAVGVIEERLADLVPFEQRVRMFEDGMDKVSDKGRVLVAEREGEIVGLAVCRRDEGGAELRDLYVIPSAWGTGVAGALHDTALDWMRERASSAVLWVAEANDRARSFYRREGWTEDGETRESPLGPYELRYRMRL
jgi:GNAT superfamily N-acetyltransferase